MSDLSPRPEHLKPKTTKLEPLGRIKPTGKVASILSSRGIPGRKPMPPVLPSLDPIGVLFADAITVKLREGTGIRLDGAGELVRALTDKERDKRLSALKISGVGLEKGLTDLRSKVQDLRRREGFSMEAMFSRPHEIMEKERAEGEKALGQELADLGLYHTLRLPGATVAELEREIDALNASDLVEIAHATPIPYLASPDIAPRTPLFGGQGYLDAAPGGIDARFAWTLPGGRGDGVRILDVEFAWRLNHEDLPAMFYDGSGVGPAVADLLGSTWAEHGTAVLGVLGAQENNYGMTGIAPRASLGVNTWAAIWGVAAAIDIAAGQLRRGDVLVVEIHWPGPTSNVLDALQNIQTGFVPVEYFPASFDVIRRATARGVIVVAAAGNGSCDLDAPYYERRFDRSFRDSGAILVGAGAPQSRVPEQFSNYGSRIDVHGWGSGVASLGYGDMPVPGAEADKRQWYTGGFSGTSSATPIVAGAAAAIQGARIQRGLEPLGPTEMRALLRDTGTAQAPDARQIGPLPDLRAALGRTLPPLPAPSNWPSLGGIVISAPCVGRYPNGTLAVFGVGTDGRLWQRWESAPDGAWVPDAWFSMGANGLPPTVRFVGRPAVAPSADGRLEVFVRGDDGHIWHLYQTAPGGGWSAWDNLGGNAVSDPAVGINDNGRLEVFFRGADNALYHNWQMWPNGGWYTFGWQSLGGNVQGSPTVVRKADSALQVFVRGTGSALQTIAQRSPGGGWTGWVHLGGSFSGDPEAIVTPTSLGVVWQVFARGTDGQCYVAWQTPTWFDGPAAFGGSLAEGSRPAVGQHAGGGVALFARFADGVVHERRQDPRTGGWTGWDPIGGNVRSDLAVGRHPNGKLHVFGVAGDGSVVHRRDP